MLLDAGANPNQPMPADLLGTGHGTGATWPAAYAAVQFGCDAELLDLLLARGETRGWRSFLRGIRGTATAGGGTALATTPPPPSVSCPRASAGTRRAHGS